MTIDYFGRIDRMANANIRSKRDIRNRWIFRKKWEAVLPNMVEALPVKRKLDDELINKVITESITPITPIERSVIVKKQEKSTDYKKRVWKLTEKVAHLIPGIEKRGFKDHHIDHIIPIWKGYKLGICEHKIADLANLRMLPYKENLKKGTSMV